MSFTIVTDSSCNLPRSFIAEWNLVILPLNYRIDGQEFESYGADQEEEVRITYTLLRAGKQITTSLPNPANTYKKIEDILAAGNDLLYVGFSSALSGTFNSTEHLLRTLGAEYPERKVFAIDTLAASLGMGMLVKDAVEMRAQGRSIEDIAAWLEVAKYNQAHWFTVEDMMYLYRGGRVTRTKAIAATVLSVKPILHMDNNGCLIPMETVRGRKKSFQALLSHMEKLANPPISEQEVWIVHGDCKDEAEAVAKMICDRLGCKSILIDYIDPVIGSHVGPGTIGVFFKAIER